MYSTYTWQLCGSLFGDEKKLDCDVALGVSTGQRQGYSFLFIIVWQVDFSFAHEIILQYSILI